MGLDKTFVYMRWLWASGEGSSWCFESMPCKIIYKPFGLALNTALTPLKRYSQGKS
jgi:hypothetical protein